MNEDLVTKNLGLIPMAIKQLNLSWETDDEYQQYYDAGLEGLIRSAKKYDPSTGYKPSTFLVTSIKNYIKRELYLKTMPKRYNPNGRDISLNYRIIESDNMWDEQTLGDIIPDPNVNIEEDMERKMELEKVLNAIDNLENEDDKIYVKYRFGLIDGKCYTYEEIGKKSGISRQRVDQRIKRAIKEIQLYLKKNDYDVSIKKEPKPVYKERRNNMEKPKQISTLLDLNTVLFNQINKINSEEDLEKEIRKSYAISQLSQQIVANTNTCIKAMKLAKDKDIKANDELNLIGLKYVD